VHGQRGTCQAIATEVCVCVCVTVVKEASRAVDPGALPTNDEDDRAQLDAVGPRRPYRGR